MKWGAGALFGTVLLPVIAAVALFGSGNCSTAVSAPGASTKTASQIVQYFASQGLTMNAAAGVVGNLQQESGLNPTEAGGGLAQWNPSWYAQMAAFATSQGLDPSSMAGQLAYLAWDIKGPYKGLLDQMNAASSPSIAALLFMDGYEQCSGAGPRGGITFVAGSLCNAPARQRYAEAAAGGGGVPVSAGPACASAGTVGVINNARLGPTTNPVPGAIMNRLDMGFDGTETRAFLSPYNGRVTYSSPSDSGWKGGGYVAVQSTSDPSMCYYAAEGLTPIVQVGEVVQVGQPIATPRPSPYNSIVGNFEVGRCTPSNPRDPLAHNVPDPKGMVLAFYAWMRSLGVGATTNASIAGYA